MNEAHSRAIQDLVADYESMSEGGVVTFVEEGAYERLIEFYEADEELDQALEVVLHALKQFPYSIDFHLKKSQLLICDGRAEEALTSLEEATIYSPQDPNITLLQAEANISLGQLEEAAAFLEGLKPEADRDLLGDIFFLEAMIYEEQQLHESMYFALVAALRESPTHHDALERIWMAIELCKRHEEAIPLFEQILDIDAYTSLAWYNLGHARAYQGQYREAIECYEYAYLADEKFEQAYRDCAEMCFELRLYNKALSCYEDLIEHFSADADVLLRIGQCHQYMGNTKIAQAFYNQALHHDPLDDEVLFHLGECHALDRNWAQAIRFYRKAIKIEETREEYFGALAEAYFQKGNLEEAETNFELAIETAPEESRYWIRFMYFLLQTGRGEEALDLIEEADEYAAGSELTYSRVACLLVLGRRQEALYWLGEALEEDYEKHRTLFELFPDLERDPDVMSLIAARMM